jgi:F-type H+-transporting ATPase subunit b
LIDINATIIAQILNFLVLVIFLRAVAYKPVVGMLKARQDKIAESLEKADADKLAAEKTLKEYQAKLAAAQIKAQDIIDKAERMAQEEHDARVRETKHEIEQMKKAAQEEIAMERAKAVQELKGEVVNLSLAAAGKIITKHIDAKDEDKLIGEFIAQLDKNKVGDLTC